MKWLGFVFCLFSVSSVEAESCQELVRWLEANAASFGKNLSTDSRHLLDASLEGKSIVYIGEPDHYIHEKYEYRLTILRRLLFKGWTHIGMEMGGSDASRINEYLQTGDETYLDRVGLYGYKGFERKERSGKQAGRLGDPSDPAKVAKMSADFAQEEKNFWRQLRDLRTRHEFEFFGFDIDVKPGGAYEDIDTILNPIPKTPLIQNLVARVAKVEGETIVDEQKRLNSLLDWMEIQGNKFEAIMSAALFEKIEGSIDRLIRSLKFAEVIYSPESKTNLKPVYDAMAEREKVMMVDLETRILAKPSAKFALLAHNVHLAKNYQSLLDGPKETAKAPSSWYTLGSYLYSTRPNKILSIWLLCDHGWHSRIHTENGYLTDSIEMPSVPNTLEADLAKWRKRKFLFRVPEPNQQSPFSQPVVIRSNSKGLHTTLLQDQADLITFYRTVSGFH